MLLLALSHLKEKICKSCEMEFVDEGQTILQNKLRLWKYDPNEDIKQIYATQKNQDDSPVHIAGQILDEDDQQLMNINLCDNDIIIAEFQLHSDWIFYNNLQDISQNQTEANESTSKNIQELKININNKYQKDSRQGKTGLQNLGNTCYMNSSIQCLSNVYDLTQYFLQNKYVNEINTFNPLGAKGQLASSYAELIKQIWQGNQGSIQPWDLKRVIQKYATQFSGNQQHDSQELLSYLLDGIHEDLNRVLDKPQNPEIEFNSSKNDETISQECVDYHKKRNNSQIVDLFHGQFKSTIICPKCNQVSIRFDPFNMLSLPVPNKELVELSFYLVDKQPNKKPKQIKMKTYSYTKVSEILKQIAEDLNKDPSQLFVKQSRQHKIEESVELDKDALFLRNHPLVSFIYELDQKMPTIQLLICKEAQNFYESDSEISYTRIMQMHPNSTFETLNLNAFYQVRSNIQQYLNKNNFQSNINIEFNLESQDLNILKNEYELLFKNSQEPFYKLYIDSNEGCGNKKPLTKESIQEFINQPNLKIKLIFSKNIKQEYLSLNKCQDHQSLDKIQNLSLQTNIYDCFQIFSNQEKLDVSNSWYCSNCQQHMEATKKLEIYKIPQICVIHLKRFKTEKVQNGRFFNHNSGKKLNTQIDFPISGLDLTTYVLGKKPNEQFIYDLIGISNHIGQVGGGHYTAFAKNHIDKWQAIFLTAGCKFESIQNCYQFQLFYNNIYLIWFILMKSNKNMVIIFQDSFLFLIIFFYKYLNQENFEIYIQKNLVNLSLFMHLLICYDFLNQNSWYEFNDHRCTKLNEKDLITSSAYILFYKKRNLNHQNNNHNNSL